MTMLARKITRGRWIPKSYLPEDAVRADAVTDLRTAGDGLSMWRCENDQEDVDQVFLALATGSQNSGFDTMDVVVLSEDELVAAGIAAEAMDGDTAVVDLKSRHVDLVRLDLGKLGQLASMLSAQVRRNEVIRRTEKQIKRLVRMADSDRRLERDALKEELRKKLKKL